MYEILQRSRMELAGWIVLTLVIYAASRAIYNLYFHPLARYPGPKIAAVSNIWYAHHWLSGRYPWAIERVFQEHGDVVRIAPNDLVFWTSKAYTDIYAHTGKSAHMFPKTKFQDIGESELGVTAERDPEKHRAARRLLNPGFSARALKTREQVIHDHTDQFVSQLNECGDAEQGVDFCEWCHWLAWDIAGDMAYGRKFESVKNRKPHETLAAFMKIGPWATTLQVSLRFPLLRPFIFLLFPLSLTTLMPKLLRMNREEMRKRIARKDELQHPDLFQYLLPSDATTVPNEEWLLSHANVLIVAGFDPHANLYPSVIYYLCKHPKKLAVAVDEVRAAYSAYGEITSDALLGLKYLQAVIEEALRLHTNAAFGLPRLCPGTTIDGHYVPKGTTVSTAFFATTHSDRFFKRARDFCPERWLPESHALYDNQFAGDDRSAFHPFSLGSRGCPGEHVSIVQARIFLAKLLWTFDIELVNGDQVDWERDCRLYALWEKPKVMARFRPVQAKA